MFRRSLFMSVYLLLALAIPALAVNHTSRNAVSVGPGHGIVVPRPETSNPCTGSTLFLNGDGSYENGFTWQYGGEVAPDYGALAEGYTATGSLCGLQLELTTLSGYFQNQSLDAYVWASDGYEPSSVLSVTTGVHISPPGIWPSITSHDINTSDANVNGEFYVGYWGNWPGQTAGWFVAGDTDGPPSPVRTNIAPGIGYPTGWQGVSAVWGNVSALGIGAYVLYDQLHCLNAPADGWLQVAQTYTGTPPNPNPTPPCSYNYTISQQCGAPLDYSKVVMTIVSPGVSIDMNLQCPGGACVYDNKNGDPAPDVTTQTITWTYSNGLNPYPYSNPTVMNEPVYFTAINPGAMPCVLQFQAFDNSNPPQTSTTRTVILGGNTGINDGPGDYLECAYGTCSPPPSGLSAWWPMDDAVLGGPTTQEFVANQPSNVRGAPKAALGQFGDCYDFINTTDYVETPTSSGGYDIGTNDFTIDAWIRTDYAGHEPAPSRAIIEKISGSPFKGYVFYFVSDGNNDYLSLGMDDGSPTPVYAHSNALDLTDQKFHFVMVTVSRSGKIQFWCDLDQYGNPKQCGTWPFSGVTGSFSNAGKATIGENASAGYRPFQGEIDELEIFNRDLSKDVDFPFAMAGLWDGKCKDVSCVLRYGTEVNLSNGQKGLSPNGVYFYGSSGNRVAEFIG